MRDQVAALEVQDLGQLAAHGQAGRRERGSAGLAVAGHGQRGVGRQARDAALAAGTGR